MVKLNPQYPNIKPRTNKISISLPKDEELSPQILQTLEKLPPLNNLRMFAHIPLCFHTLIKFIDEIFNQSKFDKKLREYMYVRISCLYGLFYEFRHNRLFSKHLGITDEEISILASTSEVTQLNTAGNLVCKAAEEITKNISISDETLQELIGYFGTKETCEVILLVSWFNMLIRFVESTRVPYEENLEQILQTGSPVK